MGSIKGRGAVCENRRSTDSFVNDVKEFNVSENYVDSDNDNTEMLEKCSNGEKTKNKSESEKMLPDFEAMYKDMPLTQDTTCGFWIFKGPFLQKFANKKAYVCLNGLVGCISGATFAYFNGIITTLEKRFKIPSKNTGIIIIGTDISELLLSLILSYYASKGHRPRWIALGLCATIVYCCLNVLLHLIYGPGEAALSLTTEFGATYDENQTKEVFEAEKAKTLCRTNGIRGAECEIEEGNIEPQVMLFLAHLITGAGSSLYHTLGISYMDDNIKKSKTPALLSLSYFLRMLGPAMGYSLASFCLRFYISPSRTPTITNDDPRWLGAWWIGWLILGTALSFSVIFIAMFPKQLPRAAIRERIAIEKQKLTLLSSEAKEKDVLPASMKDMMETLKRLLTNKILMINNIASVFYFFGSIPYWNYTPKYIEIQYKQSASIANLVTGTVALVFSAIGVLLAGIIISRYKPRARYMAAWNVMLGLLSVIGKIVYAFLGCTAAENSIIVNYSSATDLIPTCNFNCQCDYVEYSPVCGGDGKTYISACHAGCKQQYQTGDMKIYDDCSCIKAMNDSFSNPIIEKILSVNKTYEIPYSLKYDSPTFQGGTAIAGPCPMDCQKEFITFLVVMCFLSFAEATGRASNFLVSVRCVEERDKTVSMGFGMMMLSILCFIPSPIFFGMIMDKTCLVWGKTCSGEGNCWLYDGETLRYLLNFIAAACMLGGTLFDCAVWYYVKDLRIFDDEVKNKEIAMAEMESEIMSDRPA